MDNQHRKINGYRELCQEEIDLMNEIKEKGMELQTLINKVNAFNGLLENEEGEPISEIAKEAEAPRWASIARTHFQEGCMALTRAVAKPKFF